jgi:hypothetical protein
MEKLILLFAELVLRYKAESPKLFVKLQWISGIISSILTVVLVSNEVFSFGLGTIILYGTMNLPTMLAAINALLLGVFGVSKLPVKNNADIEIIESLKK